MYPMENKEGIAPPEVREIRTVCAWHEQNFGKKLVMIEGGGAHDKNVSHGMCKACAKKMLDSLDRES